MPEMKSDGKDLNDAYTQAFDYIPLITNLADQPRYSSLVKIAVGA